jgi:Ca-activated chloride channel family protein
LLLAAIASLVIATARPQADVPVAKSRTSIILVLDVSRSMCSTDVTPNRLSAAQKAARSLIEEQIGAARVGVVDFSGAAQILVHPTNDTKQLVDAIDQLTTGNGTAIGGGILAGIDAISTVNPDIAPSTVNLHAKAGNGSGKFAPDIIVLLTDGANNRGVDPQVAARQAADRGIRVYTVGFGTDNPGALLCTRQQLGPDPFGDRFGGGGGGFGGGFNGGASRFISSDQEALRRIAKETGATAHRASSANELLQVFHQLPARVVHQTEHREISVVFLGGGALLALLALALSMRWSVFP